MSCKVLMIIVVFLWTFVSCNKRFSMLLRDETLSRQEYDQKLSDRLDKIERLLFMEAEMEESLMLTQAIPEMIENMHRVWQVMDLRNKATNSALEQTEANVTTLSDKLDLQMKTTEFRLRDETLSRQKDVESLNHVLKNTKKAIEQTEATFTAILATLNIQMKTIEYKLSHNNDALIKDVENKFMELEYKVMQRHQSCFSIYKSGQTLNGVYDIYLKDGRAVKVYCDMSTDGGGWTVIQRRRDGTIDFFRYWADYKRGFGEIYGEHWLGNDLIVELTNDCCVELRIDLWDFDGAHKYAHYDSFKVLPESENYTLVVGSYSGDAGDSLSFNNNAPFSTKDRDNDVYASYNCALTWNKGAWWYKHCYNSDLNGMYLRGSNTTEDRGVNWNPWLGNKYSLKMTEMKLR